MNDSVSVGVIAQDLLEVLPEAVSTDSKGMYSVSYNGVTALLVQAVNELKDKVVVLEDVNAGLVEVCNTQQAQIEELKSLVQTLVNLR
jgi:hypothetical protein